MDRASIIEDLKEYLKQVCKNKPNKDYQIFSKESFDEGFYDAHKSILIYLDKLEDKYE